MAERRSSIFDGSLAAFKESTGSTVSLTEATAVHEHSQEKKLCYENTYQLSPSRKFSPGLVIPILQETLASTLQECRYDSVQCVQLCPELADNIKKKVIALGFPRYKLVCSVTIGQKKEQDVRVVCRCLWDTAWDNMASASFQNVHLYAVATVHALYFQ